MGDLGAHLPAAGRRAHPDASVHLALAAAAAGQLERCELSCDAVLGGDPDATVVALVGELRAAVAHLRGEFALVKALTGEPSTARAVPALVLTHRAVGADDAATASLAALHAPAEQLAALASLVGLATAGIGSAATRSGVPGEGTDRGRDLALGVAAAMFLRPMPGSTDDAEPEEVAAQVELLRAATVEGRRIAVSVPVSLDRALAAGLSRLGHHEQAAATLESAERHWRNEQAFGELVETLLLHATVSTTLGRRSLAERQASEAYALAERLGMVRAKGQALALHHPAAATGGDLGIPDERFVLMSDVVGSTRVSTTLGDEAYVELILAHHDLVRPLLASHGGTEFSEGGDSLLAWFEAPEDTLDCALAILDAVAELRRPDCELRVRVSVAGRRPYFDRGRPYGSVVNKAALLMGHADPGQVVVDENTLTRLGPVVGGFTSQTIDLGEFGNEAIGILGPSST